MIASGGTSSGVSMTLVEVHSKVDRLAWIYGYQHGRVRPEGRSAWLVTVFLSYEVNMLASLSSSSSCGLPLLRSDIGGSSLYLEWTQTVTSVSRGGASREITPPIALEASTLHQRPNESAPVVPWYTGLPREVQVGSGLFHYGAPLP